MVQYPSQRTQGGLWYSILLKELKEVCGSGFVAEKPKLGIFYQVFIYKEIDKLVFKSLLSF